MTEARRKAVRLPRQEYAEPSFFTTDRVFKGVMGAFAVATTLYIGHYWGKTDARADLEKNNIIVPMTAATPGLLSANVTDVPTLQSALEATLRTTEAGIIKGNQATLIRDALNVDATYPVGVRDTNPTRTFTGYAQPTSKQKGPQSAANAINEMFQKAKVALN